MNERTSRYRLRIQVDIEELDDHGGWTGGRLGVKEEAQLDLDSFTEIAAVLGRFHDLNAAIKRERTSKYSTKTGS
ncbi:MAG TPA: hypothetical protein VGS97_26165 [Actinocrinis sp.]|uniref:hypothetical protein n=1 Tax=Actinocrinis sp. TaxID=1920516 RepID=UPI002DDD4DF7|nr:hypothetical protein [Actinocrinis sp.]HEV2347604.1 hypothetical protein [Actinocrinis sp.]